MAPLRTPALALPARSIWADYRDRRPAEPGAMLARLPEEVRRLKAQGADLVEFLGELCALHEGYASPGVWEQVAGILDVHGLGATVHLPFLWVDLACLDREVWEGGVRSAEAALEAMAPLAPRMAAVHPANYASRALLQSLAEDARGGVMAAMGTRLVAALRRLRAAPCGDVVALENLEGMAFALVPQLAEAADVGICLDVGHAVANGDDPVSVLAMASQRLIGLHLHDAVPPGASAAPGAPTEGRSGGAGRAHLGLGSGRLDLDWLVRALAELEFTGPVVLEVEVGGPDAVADSARRFRRALDGR